MTAMQVRGVPLAMHRWDSCQKACMELTQHVFNVLPLTEGCLAAQYDQLDTGAAAEAFGIPQLRQILISAAYGNVLEVAIGQSHCHVQPCKTPCLHD